MLLYTWKLLTASAASGVVGLFLLTISARRCLLRKHPNPGATSCLSSLIHFPNTSQSIPLRGLLSSDSVSGGMAVFCGGCLFFICCIISGLV